MGNESFRYDGKRVLVVGGATGMGAAAASQVASLGADVVVMDYVPVEDFTSIVVDLRDQDQIDKAVSECGGTVDALFSCAGVADGTPGIERINFLGHRHLINRLFEKSMLPRRQPVWVGTTTSTPFAHTSMGLTSTVALCGWRRTLATTTTCFLSRRCVTTWPSTPTSLASVVFALMRSVPDQPIRHSLDRMKTFGFRSAGISATRSVSTLRRPKSKAMSWHSLAVTQRAISAVKRSLLTRALMGLDSLSRIHQQLQS
jgi:hypothetical protein